MTGSMLISGSAGAEEEEGLADPAPGRGTKAGLGVGALLAPGMEPMLTLLVA